MAAELPAAETGVIFAAPLLCVRDIQLALQNRFHNVMGVHAHSKTAGIDFQAHFWPLKAIKDHQIILYFMI